MAVTTAPSFKCEIAFGNKPGDTENNVVAATVSVGNTPQMVAVTPDGKFAYVANHGGTTVSVIDTSTNTVSATITVGNGPKGLAITPDGKTVWAGNFSDGTVSVIATATNTVSSTFNMPSFDAPNAIAFTPDGAHAYITNSGAPPKVYCFTTSTQTVSATITPGVNFPQELAITPDGTKVYVTHGPGGNTVSVIATASNTVSTTVAVGSTPQGIAITPDGAHAYVANNGGATTSVITTASNTVTGTITVGTNPYGVAASPDGAHVYVGNNVSQTVSVIATATNTVTTTVAIGAPTFDIAITPNGAYVYASNGGVSGFVSVLALATVVWTDVSKYLRGFHIQRGRQYELNQIQSGTANITFRNDSGRFDPSNAASPYSPNVQPLVPVRLSAYYNNTTYYLFTGYVERWPQSRHGPQYAETIVDAVDGFELLTNATLPTPGSGSYPQEYSGSRFTRVLNAIGWSASARSIGTGLSQMPSYTFTAADDVNALTHLQNVAQSEAGLFYIDRSGKVAFVDRMSNGQGVSVATFTDRTDANPTAIGYADITPTLDKDLIVNTWIGTRSGGSPQTATDTNSITNYFKRTQTRAPLLTTDGEVLDAMKWQLGQYSFPKRRIETISVNPNAGPTSWPQVLSMEIGNRITTIEHPPGQPAAIVQDSVVQNIDFTVTRHAAETTVVWSLQYPTASMFTLDSSTLGVLDGSVGLGY